MFLSKRGCVQLAPEARRSQEARFTQPLLEKFASLSVFVFISLEIFVLLK